MSASRRLHVEQRLRLLQVWRVEPLGEPAVGWGEQVMHLSLPVLAAPQPGQARRGAQLPRPRALLSGDRDGTSEAKLGRDLVPLRKARTNEVAFWYA